MQTKLEVGVMGQSKAVSRPERFVRSFGHLISIINQHNLEPELREEVLKIAKGYPQGSLDFFYNNLHAIIQKCQNAINLRNNVSAWTPEEVKRIERVEEVRPSKWSIVSAAEIKRAREEELEKVREVQEATRPMSPQEMMEKIKTADFTWTPSDDPELEEARRQLDYFRKNQDAIKKELEVQRDQRVE